jgi:hypothetical protein
MVHHDEPIALDPSEATSGRFYTRTEAERIVRTQAITPWLPGALRALAAHGGW